MEPFAALPEQPDAKRLLTAALREGPAHAYLLHGPAGTGKRRPPTRSPARCSATSAASPRARIPDLYVLEALGEMIRIDAVRELRRDLHMRPFEADRRVYLILSAHLLNEDAADALLKDLEEPPPYAVIVLVAERARPAAGDDPLALPARAVPAPVGEGGAGVARRPRRRGCRRTR